MIIETKIFMTIKYLYTCIYVTTILILVTTYFIFSVRLFEKCGKIKSYIHEIILELCNHVN